MDMFERRPIPPDLLDRLAPVRDLQTHFPTYFSSMGSVRHFMRTRRSALLERNLLVETPGQLLVDVFRLREHLLEILQTAPDLPVRGVTRKPAATAPAE
jgi:hypothetical protein